MPYYLVKTDGSALATVEDGTVDTTTTDLTLLGKNYPTYGLALNENLIKLLENFANVDQPGQPLYGQLWYDTHSQKLKIYRQGANEDAWQELAAVSDSDAAPADPVIGDFWYDTAAGQLKLYSSNGWIVIGPQTTNTGLLRISGTNPLVVQIGGTPVLQADFLGRVTKPINPTVQGSGTYSNTNFSTAGTAAYTLWRPAEPLLVNIGNCYNAGRFTCPVTGRYRVHANMTTLGKSGTQGTHLAQWRVNDNNYGIGGMTYHQNTTSQCLVAAGVIGASAGDVISLVCATDASSYISYQNNSYSIELVS
jgi:hypothetical protein